MSECPVTSQESQPVESLVKLLYNIVALASTLCGQEACKGNGNVGPSHIPRKQLAETQVNVNS